MSTYRYRDAIALSALVGGSLFVVGLRLRHYFHRNHPRLDDKQEVDGLRQPVEIIRDRWGVPHIYAASDADLFFAQGYVHAQDRLFQLDTGRRLGQGRLSEILGPAGLPTDRLARILGWNRAVHAQMAGLEQDAETFALVSAYTAGINAFIAQGRWPLPYRMLRFAPEPWQPADCLAWGTVLAWGLSTNWDVELIRAGLVAELGPEKAADLVPVHRADDLTIIPESALDGRLMAAIQQAFYRAAAHAPAGPLPGGPGAGSNNWVVSGDWTVTGRPILANDPHLPPLFPAIWYANHLQSEDIHVTGFAIPGVPGVVIGHNEQIAWGVTNAFPDVQDLYTIRFNPHHPDQYAYDGGWRQVEVVQEKILVRGWRQPQVETVHYTHHGPVISALLDETAGRTDDIALRWTGYETSNHLRAALGICRAQNWAEFKAACRSWSFPSQNVVYADVEGHIGYLMPGRVPLRQEGHGVVPAPGDQPEYEWAGWIPFEELPCRFDPAEGFMVTANNRVAGDDYPYWLTGDWLPPYRAQRIADLLDKYRPITLDACRKIQLDTVSLLARRFLHVAIPELEKERRPGDSLGEECWLRLVQWTYPVAGSGCDMRNSAVGPSIYHAWIATFTQAVMQQTLGEALAARLLAPDEQPELSSNPFFDLAIHQAVSWLESGAPDWVGAVQPLLAPSFQKGVQQLATLYGPDPAGWQWGRLHRIHWRPLLSRAAFLGQIWKPIVLPAGGDGYTVNQAEVAPLLPLPPVRIIASCRMILDVGQWDRSLVAMPGGQSERLDSPHYRDGLAAWAKGDYHPLLFSREQVQEAGVTTLYLTPASRIS